MVNGKESLLKRTVTECRITHMSKSISIIIYVSFFFNIGKNPHKNCHTIFQNILSINTSVAAGALLSNRVLCTGNEFSQCK